jgi:glycerophosphoryl diester phosphodiesterase
LFSWRKLAEKPFVIAHRGSSDSVPENTMAAFKKAIEDRAQAIELDVRLSRDDEVVIIHDSRLERTTNGRGKVSDFNLTDLRTYDNGLWYNPKFSGEKIPTLSEVCKLTNAKVGLDIEIKPVEKHQKLLAENCVQIIQQYKLQKSVLISSFEHSVVSAVKKIDSSIMTAIIYSPVIHLGRNPSVLAKKFDADAFVISRNYLRDNMVIEAHTNKIAVFVYTIENWSQLERMVNAKVDGVMTSSPRTIRRLLEKL